MGALPLRSWLVMVVAGCGQCAIPARDVAAAEIVVTAEMHHLRHADPREWNTFPETAELRRLERNFEARANANPATLRLRQQDVKQTWHVAVNGKRLGQLHRDENDMVVAFTVPPNTLRDGRNELRIEQDPRRDVPDDVRVGQIAVDDRPVEQVFSEAAVTVRVTDADTHAAVPCRLTIINAEGALQSVGAVSNDRLAVRPGTIYTADGAAEFGLPAGKFTLYAGRGFEYSVASRTLSVPAGDRAEVELSIRREVPTAGYVACDTHVHTRTHSGHGDATVEERMLSLAGEGIELPIATDHNVHVDHVPFAERMGVRRYFTPVIGNEVTTRIGHFNIFPVESTAVPTPDHKLESWEDIFSGIFRTPGVKVAILNHGRDLHGGTRPLGPKLHNAAVGKNLEDWPARYNAMEVVNSGATQTNPLQLIHDWMAHLNSGHRLTPVGSSDSHDVARHFVGQGRTYIRCDDRDPAHLDVAQAVENFLQGRVMVSYGLLTELHVDGKYGPGEVAPAIGDTVRVSARVLGPHWVRAETILLYANGHVIREEHIAAGRRDLPPGVKWDGGWEMERPAHDVHLAAVAIGPGISDLYWATAKPYQPTSPDPATRVVGCSGAIWLDVDGDSRPTPAFDYARRLTAASRGDLRQLLSDLDEFDAAVASQAAHVFQSQFGSLLETESQAAINSAADPIRAGFRDYLQAWRESEIARSQ